MIIDQDVSYFQYKNIQMPSFDYLVCNWYFEWIRLISIKKDPTIAKCAIATLHHMRDQYNKKNDENSDNNPFKILRIECKVMILIPWLKQIFVDITNF